jgi:hypothetical protein
MVVGDIDTVLSEVVQISDNKEQTTRLQTIIDELILTEQISSLCYLPKALLSSNISQATLRASTIHLAKALLVLPEDKLQMFLDAATATVSAIKSYSGNLDEADLPLREGLFQAYLSQGQFKEAAFILAGVNLESASRTNFEKADIHVRCAECCLRADETMDAKMYVNKASEVMNSATEEVENSSGQHEKIKVAQLELRYRVINARVLDANR